MTRTAGSAPEAVQRRDEVPQHRQAQGIAPCGVVQQHLADVAVAAQRERGPWPAIRCLRSCGQPNGAPDGPPRGRAVVLRMGACAGNSPARTAGRSHGRPGRHQVGHRRAAGQHRHRRRQVRRLRPHQFVLHAGRGDPLRRRRRQPGAAAARGPAVGEAAVGGAPVRLRGGSATSGRSSWRWRYSHSAPGSPSTRASTRCATPTRSRDSGRRW